MKIGYLFVLLSCFIADQVSAQEDDVIHNDLADGVIYLINRTSVLRYSTFQNGSIDTKDVTTIYKNIDGHIRSLELDPHNQHVFWGDFKQNAIYKSSLDGGNLENLFQYGIGYPQGLTVDWSSNILYWTDSLMKMIELATITGKHRKVLFRLENGDEPRGIISDPINGLLFWTDWGNNPKIERCTLSGEYRTTIVSSDIIWPNDLAVDIYSKQIYWIDAYKDRLEVSAFDGLNRHVVIPLAYQSYVIHPFSFTMLQNTSRAYITDWYSDGVFFVNQIHSNVTTDLLFENSRGQKNIGQIRHLANWYPKVSSPCQTFHHTCSHLCLKNGVNKAKCACPDGFVLANSTTCKPAVKYIEIYFADDTLGEIFHLTKYKQQDGFTTQTLLSESGLKKSPIAIDYHKKENLIYWTDKTSKMILRSKLDGSELSPITNELSSVFKAIGIDQLNHVLYYFDSVRKSIMMTSLDGNFTMTVKSDEVMEITDIALYEEKGLIFFSDYKDKAIGRMATDGSDVKIMQKLEHARSLSFDKSEERLYWTNDDDFSIKSSDYNFQDVRVLIQESIYMFGRFWLLETYGTIVKPFSISVYGNKVYWSDTYKQAIFATNKHFGGEIEYITSGLKTPRDLHVFSNQDGRKNTTSSVYMFSFANTTEQMHNADGRSSNTVRASCWSSHDTCDSYEIDDPLPCPPGYKEKRMENTCSNCSETIGKKFVCPCDTWENCAQRTFSKIKGCSSKQRPFIRFKVRECVKENRVGYCPFNSLQTCRFGEASCVSDTDCSGDRKCCETLCGQKCLQPTPKIESPCAQQNGGCSHLCITSQNKHHCACPDYMQLEKDGKTCSPIVDICHMKADHGPCESSFTQYFYNKNSGICEPFLYGGCQGNKNRFTSEKECADKCQGGCYGNRDCGVNGVCQKTSSGDVTCKCKQKYWIGDRCQIDIRLHVVKVTFTKDVSGIKEITMSKMARLLASYYSKFCSEESCSYSSSIYPVKRVRRNAENDFDFKDEDIYFREWSSKDDEIAIQYVLTGSGDENKNSYLGQNDIIRGMNSFGNDFGKEFGLKFKSAEIIFERVAEEKRRMKSVKILLVAFFLIITILGVSAAGYYCYLLRKSKRRETPANDGVRWAFENRLYDDMNNAVTLPIDNSTVVNESFVNPIFERKTSQAEARSDENKSSPVTDSNETGTATSGEPANNESVDKNGAVERNMESVTPEEIGLKLPKENWVDFDEEDINNGKQSNEAPFAHKNESNGTPNPNDIDGFVYVDDGEKNNVKKENVDKKFSVDMSKSDV